MVGGCDLWRGLLLAPSPSLPPAPYLHICCYFAPTVSKIFSRQTSRPNIFGPASVSHYGRRAVLGGVSAARSPLRFFTWSARFLRSALSPPSIASAHSRPPSVDLDSGVRTGGRATAHGIIHW